MKKNWIPKTDKDPFYDVYDEIHCEHIDTGADDDYGKHVELDAIRSPVVDDTQYAQGEYFRKVYIFLTWNTIFRIRNI